MLTVEEAKQELLKAKRHGLLAMLLSAERAHNLPRGLMVGLASRETNITNELGDGGHGVGLVQIDVRSHEIARRMKADGSWRTHPELLVNYGAQLLAANIQAARRLYPKFGGSDGVGWRKIGLSAYNAGPGGVAKGIRLVGDSDRYTTGRNYGADVLNRAAIFQNLLTP